MCRKLTPIKPSVDPQCATKPEANFNAADIYTSIQPKVPSIIPQLTSRHSYETKKTIKDAIKEYLVDNLYRLVIESTQIHQEAYLVPSHIILFGVYELCRSYLPPKPNVIHGFKSHLIVIEKLPQRQQEKQIQ